MYVLEQKGKKVLNKLKKYMFRFFQTIVRDEPDVVEGTPEDSTVTISQLILEAHQAFVITNQDIEKLR